MSYTVCSMEVFCGLYSKAIANCSCSRISYLRKVSFYQNCDSKCVNRWFVWAFRGGVFMQKFQIHLSEGASGYAVNPTVPPNGFSQTFRLFCPPPSQKALPASVCIRKADRALFFASTFPAPRSLVLSLIINFAECVIVFVQKTRLSPHLRGNWIPSPLAARQTAQLLMDRVHIEHFGALLEVAAA